MSGDGLRVPRASIIIRAFNEERHLGRCLEGVYGQEAEFPFEVVLVDSGSTDATLDIARRFGATVVSIRPEDFSFGYSLNRGIERAGGEFCVMLSAHCYPSDAHWLVRLLRPFADPDVALSYGKQRGNHTTRYSEHQLFAQWFPDESVGRQALPFCNNANAAVRRSLWVAQPFDERITGMEDVAWATRAIGAGRVLAYAADACVVHVHEETARQIYVRYEREALALRAIYPGHAFGFVDFLKLFVLNAAGDALHAVREGVLLRHLASIVTFRFLQFWATYRAHREPEQLTAELRRRLYYPNRLSRGRSRELGPAEPQVRPARRPAPNGRLVHDITRRLHPGLPVWPGTSPFALEWLKQLDRDGVNESRFVLNAHTGTHVDAPYHFVAGGKRVPELDLHRMIGDAYVLEYPHDGPIRSAFLAACRLPPGCSRVLFKTRNAAHWSGPDFSPGFVALAPDAARWLVERSTQLVGIDGHSIQCFTDRTNETHDILLRAEVVVLEGLALDGVPEGWYRLIALPMSVDGAEGAPVRAVLLEGGW